MNEFVRDDSGQEDYQSLGGDSSDTYRWVFTVNFKDDTTTIK